MSAVDCENWDDDFSFPSLTASVPRPGSTQRSLDAPRRLSFSFAPTQQIVELSSMVARGQEGDCNMGIMIAGQDSVMGTAHGGIDVIQRTGRRLSKRRRPVSSYTPATAAFPLGSLDSNVAGQLLDSPAVETTRQRRRWSLMSRLVSPLGIDRAALLEGNQISRSSSALHPLVTLRQLHPTTISTRSRPKAKLTTSTSTPALSKYHDQNQNWPYSTTRSVIARVRSLSRPMKQTQMSPPTPPSRRTHGTTVSLPMSASTGHISASRPAVGFTRSHTLNEIWNEEEFDDQDHEEDDWLERGQNDSALRIPSRISLSQSRIEVDLERVKEFALGIEGLKSLRDQYNRLRNLSSPAESSCNALSKTLGKIAQLHVEYQSWWQQVDTLVNLGDGGSKAADDQPVATDKRRDRCTSMGNPLSVPPSTMDEHEDESEEEVGGARTRTKTRPRRSSASLAERQHNMLRQILVEPIQLPRSGKRTSFAEVDQGSSFSGGQSRSLKPSPVVGMQRSASTSVPLPRRSSQLRRVSEAGIAGFRQLLLRLQNRRNQQVASINGKSPSAPKVDTMSRRSTSNPIPARTIVGILAPSTTSFPTSMSQRSVSLPIASRSTPTVRASSTVEEEEEEDWDRASMIEETPVNSSLESTRTLVNNGPLKSSDSSREVGGERLVMTAESIPSLLAKVHEVQERCEECLILLKRLTL